MTPFIRIQDQRYEVFDVLVWVTIQLLIGLFLPLIGAVLTSAFSSLTMSQCFLKQGAFSAMAVAFYLQGGYGALIDGTRIKAEGRFAFAAFLVTAVVLAGFSAVLFARCTINSDNTQDPAWIHLLFWLLGLAVSFIGTFFDSNQNNETE